jgi:PAS domain S-box-containing protein
MVTLRSFLARFVLISILPLVLITAYFAFDKVREIQTRAHEEADKLASNVVVALEGEIDARIAALEVMATSPLLDKGRDLREFYRLAQGFRSSFDGHVVLADAMTMQMVLNTRRPFGSALPRLPVPKGHAAAPEVVRTGEPSVGDLFYGPVAEAPLVAVVVPVFRGKQLKYLLLSIINTTHFQGILEKLTLPRGWAISLFDGANLAIAEVPGDSFATSAKPRTGGAFWVRKELEVARWALVLQSPDGMTTRMAVEALLTLLAAVAVAVAAGLLGGKFAGRRLRQAVDTLVDPDAPQVPDLAIKEVEDARHRIVEASAARDAAQRRTTESEERFRGLVEQSISGILIVQDGRLAYVNPRFAEIMGYDEAAPLIGKRLEDMIAPADRDEEGEIMEHLLAGEERSRQFYVRARRCDGKDFFLGVHATRIVYEDAPAVLGMAQDITERQQAEAQIAHYIEQLEKSMLGTIRAVSTIMDKRDPYTAGHERRVGLIARAIAEEMGLDEGVQKGLDICGAIHDVGTIAVPAEILSRPGRLTEAEFAMVKSHAATGYEILSGVDFPWPIADVVRQHHERLDGSGYPDGLKGDEILLEARIMAVADVVEAMSSHRPYRAALGTDAALAEIEDKKGVAYDAAVVDACVRLFREKGFRLPA